MEIVPNAAKPTQRIKTAEGREAAKPKKPPRGTNYGGFAHMTEYEAMKQTVEGSAKVNSWHARVGDENTGYLRTAVGREAKRCVEHHCVVQHRLNVIAAAKQASTSQGAATKTRSGMRPCQICSSLVVCSTPFHGKHVNGTSKSRSSSSAGLS